MQTKTLNQLAQHDKLHYKTVLLQNFQNLFVLLYYKSTVQYSGETDYAALYSGFSLTNCSCS